MGIDENSESRDTTTKQKSALKVHCRIRKAYRFQIYDVVYRIHT